MEEQEGETDENSPCKRQRFLQGERSSDDKEHCILSELRANLGDSESTVVDTVLPKFQQNPPVFVTLPNDAGDREPDSISASVGTEHPTQRGKNFSENQSNNSTVFCQASDAVTDFKPSSQFICCNTERSECTVQRSESAGKSDFHYSEVKVLSFGKYDFETGEMTEHPIAAKNVKCIKQLMCEDRGHSNSTNNHGNRISYSESGCYGNGGNFSSFNSQPNKHFVGSDESDNFQDDTYKRQNIQLNDHQMDLSDSNTDDNNTKVKAMAENSFIATLEKMKFKSKSLSPDASVASIPGQKNILPTSKLTRADNGKEESGLVQISSEIIMPPDVLSDSGFIEMFSNDYVNTQKIGMYEHSDSNNSNRNVNTKSSFKIKPGYLSGSSERILSKRTEFLPSHMGRKRPNGPFVETCRESAINCLPSSLLVEIFKNFTPYALLRRVSLVCKYWYNMSRDPDLWRTMNLRNQHKLTDELLEQLLSFSERVLHVNLTDCRFVTNRGVKAVLSRCIHIRSLKLMRCFDITDEAFVELSLRQLCTQLSALHLDGCCKITDRTILEVAEACKNLQLLHLNQCSKVTDTGITALARNCPRLRQLLLDHCDKVTDVSATELVQGCPDLVYLNFMSCGVSDEGIKQFSKLKNLANVDLSNIPRLTPRPVMEIARSCQRLECINLSLNSVMNDDCVSYIVQYCRQLKRLYCVSCHVTDRGLEDIAKYCPSLEALDVGWCQDVTDSGVRMIPLACKNLGYFGLIRCDKVTIDTMEELVLKYPHINFSTFILESKRLLERARREGLLFGLSVEKTSSG